MKELLRNKQKIIVTLVLGLLLGFSQPIKNKLSKSYSKSVAFLSSRTQGGLQPLGL